MRSRATCSSCGADVEALTYCGVCGASLRGSPAAAKKASGGRLRRFHALRSPSAAVLILTVGAVTTLAALLSGAPGIALAVAAVVPSLLIVHRLTRIDVFERAPVRIWYLVGLAGFVAGILIAIADAFVIERFWFSGATFHAGAAGFAGDVAYGEGSPPVMVLALGGIILPLVALGLQLALPLALRRLPALRNEVVDGVILGAAAGGGFATATAIVYFWPLIADARSGIGVADGTAMILGIVLVRPLLLTLIAALTAAGIWHSALSGRSGDLVIPIASALAALFLYAIVDRLLIPFGAVAELGWLVVVTTVLAVIGRRELQRAVRYDRQSLLSSGGRAVCPHCRSVTPAGAYCATCGKALRDQGAKATRPNNAADEVVELPAAENEAGH